MSFVNQSQNMVKENQSKHEITFDTLENRSRLSMVIVVFCQVLWEMLTQEVPFKGLLGVQVAWLVVVDEEVRDSVYCCLFITMADVA